MNRSQIMKSKQRDLPIIHKEIDRSFRSDFTNEPSPSPSNFMSHRYKSKSPNWDRLSKPRYISPQISRITHNFEENKNDRLPFMNKRRKNWNKLKQRIEDTLLIYNNSVKSLLNPTKHSDSTKRIRQKPVKADKNLEIRIPPSTFSFQSKLSHKNKRQRNLLDPFTNIPLKKFDKNIKDIYKKKA